MRIYEIRPGDTLSEIAEHFNIPLKALAYINDIPNPDIIRAGEYLLLPEVVEW